MLTSKWLGIATVAALSFESVLWCAEIKVAPVPKGYDNIEFSPDASVAEKEKTRLLVIWNEAKENWNSPAPYASLTQQIQRMIYVNDSARKALFEWYISSRPRDSFGLTKIDGVMTSELLKLHQMIEQGEATSVGVSPKFSSTTNTVLPSHLDANLVTQQTEFILYYTLVLRKYRFELFKPSVGSDALAPFVDKDDKRKKALEFSVASIEFFNRHCSSLHVAKYIGLRLALIPNTEKALRALSISVKEMQESGIYNKSTLPEFFLGCSEVSALINDNEDGDLESILAQCLTKSQQTNQVVRLYFECFSDPLVKRDNVSKKSRDILENMKDRNSFQEEIFKSLNGSMTHSPTGDASGKMPGELFFGF